MKKSFLILFFVSLTTFIFAQQVKYTYNFDDYKLIQKGEYQIVEFQNTLQVGIAGEPMLPYHAVKLMLPYGQSAQNIKIIAEDLTKIEGEYNLFPRQYERPISKPEAGDFIINEEVYNKTKYPENQINGVSTQFMNGYSFAISTFTPVVYNPKNGELSYYKKITIVIDYAENKDSKAATNNLCSSAKVIKRVSSFAQNPEMLKTYPKKKTDDEYQVLIITTSTYENSFSDLQALYLTRGLLSEVITKSEIVASTNGDDTQEKIRNYIINQYQNNGIEHVLLAGDVELIPYRGFYCEVQSSSVYEDDDIPSDLYYSALDGNWNTDGDNKWAEPDEDDLLPEISVARMSFSNTTELNSMLNKIIMYQNEPVTGELNNPLLAGEHLYDAPETWGAQYLELLVGFHDDNGYETTGIPEEHPYEEMYARDQDWDGDDIIAEINTGHPFVHHVGHSNTNYTMFLYNSDITNANFSQTNGTTHNYTLVYTHGCICGDFAADDCIAEHMVKIDNFAVAFVGNSRYGWFNEGQTEGPSAHIHREFIDALYDQKENHIGATHMISKYNTAPWVEAAGQHEHGALRWCFYDCNVLSDPVLQIWTDEPISINTNYSPEVVYGGNYSVTIISAKAPIEGLTCAIIQNEQLIGVGHTDANGIANINIDYTISELGEATLYVTGYNCLKTIYDLTIIEANEPYITVESYSPNQGDFNQTVNIALTLQNLAELGSGYDTDNVQATISITDDYVTITNATANLGGIAAGNNTTLENAFTIEIADNVPDQYNFNFALDITADDAKYEWSSNINITAQAPILEIDFSEISDASDELLFTSTPITEIVEGGNYSYDIEIMPTGGNGNNMLDAGETVGITVNTGNTGHADLVNATCTLTSTNEYVTVNTAEIYLGTIVVGSELPAIYSISIDEDCPVGESVELIFTLVGGGYNQELVINLTVGLQIKGFENGDFSNYGWTFGGNADWVIDADAYEGENSVKSGVISDEQTSELSMTCNVSENSQISFYSKVSSEPNYDYLRFYIDGIQKDEWSGVEVDWAEHTYDVTADSHTFKWAYEKDGSVSNGDDCGWVDYIIFPGHTSSKGEKNITISGTTLPSWLSLTDNENGTANLTGTAPNEIGIHDVIIEATSAGSTSTQEFDISVRNVNIISNTGVISIYPNPTTDYINILLPSKAENSYVVITDVSGKIIQKTTINNDQLTIDLTNQTPGVYMLELNFNNEIFKQTIIVE